MILNTIKYNSIIIQNSTQNSMYHALIEYKKVVKWMWNKLILIKLYQCIIFNMEILNIIEQMKFMERHA